jgi:GH24 family phage-related lysozyme (muramidase)
MENRFLQMNDYLGQVAKTRGPALLRPRRSRAPLAVPAALAIHQSIGYATQFAAADRVLVILIENKGVDLGIPDLVDKLLSSVPGANLVPDATRQQLVEFIREKIKALTDSLIETAELTLNRYAGSKPEFFGDVIVLRDGTASYNDLKQTLLAQSRQGKIIDILILTHGGQDSIDVTGNVTGQKIKDIRTELGSPLTIRSVYMMNCVGSSLNQAWLDAGARVSSGSIRNNYLPEPTTFFFWQNWKAGKPFEESVTAAYRKTINVMNEAVRGFVRSLPVPGSGAIADAIEFENMDFVRDSAPVIQGQRSLTISSDDLSAAQSTASSLATTVLHVGLLQSLRSTAFDATAPAPAPARTRAISPAGLDLIKKWEGFRPVLCNDNGTCTIGYGTWLHTGPCDGRPVEQPYAAGISEEAAAQLLSQRAADVRHVIEELVTVPLTQNQSDALISLVYDIGGDSFKGSTLLQLLNAGSTSAVAAEIRKWTREQRPDGGQVDVPSLMSRRQVEADLFLKPDAAAAQTLSLGGRRFAGAFEAVNYSIPGVLPVIAQPTPMTCWAAVITMMWSWKNNRSMAIRDALSEIGPAYVSRFDSGQGLDGTTARTLYNDAHLEVIEGLNPTIEGWESSLKKYGPLYVDVGNIGSTNTHAIIVTGMSGDGTPAGTRITYVNPAGGQTETKVFSDFLQKYERPGAVQWPYPIVHWPVGALSAQNSLYSHTYAYDSPSFVMKPRARLSEAKFLPAGIAAADAAQIGLAAVSVAQAQASASQGSFTLTYDQASRLLTPGARLTYPPIAKTNYTRRLLYLGISRLNAAEADVLIDWAGNAYGEIQTPVIRRNLDTSSEWTKSSASINIKQIGSIPEWTLDGDPRAWPIVYHFEGTYDPWGNGYFEFDGDFQIDAFGGIKIRYKVVSRALADWALSGTPEQFVQRGADFAGTVPPIPEAQLKALRGNPPS